MTELFSITLYNYLMIFLRLGTVFMLMPGFSASYVNIQVRLIFALSVSLVVMPMITPILPPEPSDFSLLFQYIINEISVGIFIGVFMQIMFFALSFAGALGSQAIGFANAQMFDPSFQTQSTLIESFLGISAISLIFITDIHHLMINAILDSYFLFKPGAVLSWADFASFITENVSKSFSVGFRIGSPFIAFTIIFYAGIGLISRLMPQLNIFFLSLPLQIYLGIGVLFLTAPIMISVFFRYFDDGLYIFHH